MLCTTCASLDDCMHLIPLVTYPLTSRQLQQPVSLAGQPAGDMRCAKAGALLSPFLTASRVGKGEITMPIRARRAAGLESESG